MTRTAMRSVVGALFTLALLLISPAAHAAKIERVVSPGGIEAWLVHETSLPLIAMEFAFDGGADQDPADKTGLANVVAGLLDEGAGNLDAKAFQQKLEELATTLRFTAGRERLNGSLRTLVDNRNEAFGLVKLALTSPRFDPEAIERVRAQVTSQLKRDAVSPNSIASKRWWSTAFADHPYGRPTSGTLDTVAAITVDDMRTFVRRTMAKDDLKIAVVGDIDAATLGALLDDTFGSLPAKADLVALPDVAPRDLGKEIKVDLDVPQAVVAFGTQGIGRHDPDFVAAYIVNHILGGGTFSSRLYEEVREKRGLAYGVSSSLFWLDHAAIYIGYTATRADRSDETVAIIQNEIRRMAESGPTEDELNKAKAYLKGAYALAFDTSSKIAGQLLQIQIDKLGIDYVERRSSLIDAVTLDDAKRVAKRLFGQGLLITVVGKPQPVPVKNTGG